MAILNLNTQDKMKITIFALLSIYIGATMAVPLDGKVYPALSTGQSKRVFGSALTMWVDLNRATMFCGACVIYGGVALSASLCASQYQSNPRKYQARVYYDLESVNPYYTITAGGAVLRVDDLISDDIKLVRFYHPEGCYYGASHLVYQEPADFSPVLGGWVHPRSDDDNNIYSTEVDFEIVDNSNCNTQYNVQLKEDQFCAKPKNENIYIELADLGSPLTKDTAIIGMAVLIPITVQCGSPIIFTNITYYTRSILMHLIPTTEDFHFDLSYYSNIVLAQGRK